MHKQYDDLIHFLNVSSLNQTSYAHSRFNITSNLGTYTFDDIEENFFSSNSYNGPFPLAVRYINPPYYVIERPPFQIKVDYSPTYSSKPRRPIKPVTIWIPWTVCIVDTSNYSTSKIFFNDGPLQSIDDEVLVPWTSNVFGDAKLCMGSSSPLVFQEQQGVDLQSWYSNFMNEYFFGGWNQDITNYNPSIYHSVSPNYFPANYSSTEIQKLDATILNKINNSRIKFYSSKYWSLKQANIYYNFSLLSLDQTLDFTRKMKQAHPYNSKKLSSNFYPSHSHLALHNLNNNLRLNPYNKYPIILSINFNNETSLYNKAQGYSAHALEYSKYKESFYREYFPKISAQQEAYLDIAVHSCYYYAHGKNVFDVFSEKLDDILDQAVSQSRTNPENFELDISISAPITPSYEQLYELVSNTTVGLNLKNESISI